MMSMRWKQDRPLGCKIDPVMWALMESPTCFGCNMRDNFCGHTTIDLDRNDRLHTKVYCKDCGQHTVTIVGTNRNNGKYVLKCQNKKCNAVHFSMDKDIFVSKYIGGRNHNGKVVTPTFNRSKFNTHFGGNKSISIDIEKELGIND